MTELIDELIACFPNREFYSSKQIATVFNILAMYECGRAGMRPFKGSSHAQKNLCLPELLQKIHAGQTKLSDILELMEMKTVRATTDAVAWVSATKSVEKEAYRGLEAHAKVLWATEVWDDADV